MIAELELELQRLAPERHARHADDLHDLLADLGPLDDDEIARPQHRRPDRLDRHAARTNGASSGSGTQLAAVEDAARLRDALGLAIPAGLPTAFTDPVAAATRRSRRPLRAHARSVRASTRWWPGSASPPNAPCGALLAARSRPAGSCTASSGPAAVEREWCDAGVLRSLRRRSLAALRHEVEPVDAVTFVRFLSAWHGIGRGRRGTDALVDAIEQLQGVAIPVSVLERDVLPARVEGYRPAMLDELCAAGELVWTGAGALGADDGRVRLFFRDRVKLLASSVVLPEPPEGPLHDAIREQLARAGASFWPDLVAAAGNRRRSGAPHRALGSRVGGRDHQRHVRAAARFPSHDGAAIGTRPPAPGPAHPSRTTRRRRALVARRAAPRSPRPPPPRSRTRSRCNCSSATASSPARRYAPKARPAASPACTPCCARSKKPGEPAAAGSSPGSARRSSRCPVPSIDCARTGTPRADEPGRVVVLAATDPAQPYGAALGWPEHPAAAGRLAPRARTSCSSTARASRIVERGGRTLLTFNALSAVDEPDAWVNALVEAHKEGRLGRLQIERIDDEPARTSRHAPLFRAAGFADGYKGLTLHK